MGPWSYVHSCGELGNFPPAAIAALVVRLNPTHGQDARFHLRVSNYKIKFEAN
jgi:hypothetical protein